jgi:NCS1 nucleoside transporter family
MLLDKKTESPVAIRFRKDGNISSVVNPEIPLEAGSMIWTYLLWFTAMVGFWATMSISISDITRFARSQADQVAGQFIGLPGTMLFYSFTGIFVTYASISAFPDILVGEDAPWDPVNLVSRFSNPWVVVFAQISMLIATLSTNIAANIIAPAYAISNLSPQKISFQKGGILAGIIGILTCPWLLLNEISSVLVFVSGLLGPVLGVLLCDYFIVRKTHLKVEHLFRTDGIYLRINQPAMIALFAGVLLALIGYWWPGFSILYSLSWFTGFGASFGLYAAMMNSIKKDLPEGLI